MKAQYDFSDGKRGPVLKAPAAKTRITIRIDDDLLQWLRKQVHAAGGGSYHAALREYVGTKREPLEATLRRVLREELPRDLKRAAGR